MTTATQQQLITQCAWCCRIRRGGEWVAEVARTVQTHNGCAVSHGMCPACSAKEIAKLTGGGTSSNSG